MKTSLATLGFSETDEGAATTLRLDRNLTRKDEYRLSIASNAIQLSASNEHGLYHGLVTLRAVLEQSDDSIACMKIVDWPDIPNRGYMLDISRCKVPTMESLYELVDLLAALKYNQFQLYTEHTFAYRDHRIVWANASPMTAEEIRELDTYCYNRYIELVPNQNSFGHMERWLRHQPYKHLAESPNGFQHPLAGWKQFGSTLKPTHESLEFVDSLFAELLPNFRSRKLNIGGDEPWELGQGFSQQRVNEIGKHRVYLDHLLKLHQRVEARQHAMQFWGDILLEDASLAKQLPRNVTALLWGYEQDHPFADQCAAMRESGVPFHVVPGTSTWNTIGGRLDNAFANIRSAASNAIAHGADGLLLTDWGDNGHHQSHLLSLPPLLKAAGVAWSFAESEHCDLRAVATILLPESISESEYDTILQLSEAARFFKAHLHNSTWLNKILFAKPNEHAALEQTLSNEELDASLQHLQQMQPPQGDLELARDLLVFAACKGKTITAKRAVSPIPQELIISYRNAWLERYRDGGLNESVSYLTVANP